MRIVLHIGTDKTGSTSIQSTAFLNREWLSSHSIYLPATGLGKDNGHSSLLSNLDSQSLAQLREEILQADERGYRQVLLSWEGMAAPVFGKEQIRQLLLSLAGFDIHILVYLREQAEAIQSGRLQRVKMGTNPHRISALARPRTPAEKFRAFFAVRSSSKNYYRLLRRWQSCAPQATFAVRIFDKHQLRGGDVVVDFLDQLNINTDAGFLPARRNANISLSVEAALLLESLQRNPDYRADMALVVDITESITALDDRSTKYFLDERTVASVRRHYSRSNLKLARHFMGIEDYPFKTLSHCWRTESLDSIEVRANSLRKSVDELRAIPTLQIRAEGEEIASKIDLSQGWSKTNSWGVWSKGKESRIKFRVFRRRLTQQADSLRLHIEGRYYGDNHRTRVHINGMDFGERDLRRGGSGIEMPIDALLTHEVIDIVLEHQAPASPAVLEGAGDKRELAFGIERVRYAVFAATP